MPSTLLCIRLAFSAAAAISSAVNDISPSSCTAAGELEAETASGDEEGPLLDSLLLLLLLAGVGSGDDRVVG